MPFINYFSSAASEPITVTELNEQIKVIIDQTFRNVHVIGEISNLKIGRHIYFNLKDENSTIRCAIWQSQKDILTFDLEEGLKVVCRGNINTYVAGGYYSLSLQEITPHGEGSVQQALKKLIAKLEKEGLFLPQRKKPIPSPPRIVAVVTSTSGAAIRDFLNMMLRRSRRADILICPVLVQGIEASRDIEKTLALLNCLPPHVKPDVIALIRGGGSVEDLWTFNEERIARAVAASTIPIVSGIGHEQDVTLSDMAADLRATTPTDAAVKIFPDDSHYPTRLRQIEKQIDYLVSGKCAELRSTLEGLSRASVFQNPNERLIQVKKISCQQIENRLRRTADDTLTRANARIATLSASLEALSPLAVLSRGFSITLNEHGHAVRDASAVSPGQILRTRVDRGELISSVVETITPEHK